MPGVEQVCTLGRGFHTCVYFLRRGRVYSKPANTHKDDMRSHKNIYDGQIRKIAILPGDKVRNSKMFFLTSAGTLHLIDVDGEGQPLIETVERPVFAEVSPGGTLTTSAKVVNFSITPGFLDALVVYALTEDGLIFAKESTEVEFHLIESPDHPLVALTGDMFAQTSGVLRETRHLRKGVRLLTNFMGVPDWSFNDRHTKSLHDLLRRRHAKAPFVSVEQVSLGVRNSAIARDLDGLRKKELVVCVKWLLETRKYDMLPTGATLEMLVKSYSTSAPGLKVMTALLAITHKPFLSA